MGSSEAQSFYVQAWMVRAVYLLAAVQLGFALVLFALGSTIDVGPVLPFVFLVGAALTGYQAFWTSRTPIATVDTEGVQLRPALLARAVHLRFRDVRAFARIPPGWLIFLAADGEETRLPLTALSEADADRMVALVRQHLSEVSYIED